MRKSKLYKLLEQSLKEVKLHKEGKIHLDTWDEYISKKQKKKAIKTAFKFREVLRKLSKE